MPVLVLRIKFRHVLVAILFNIILLSIYAQLFARFLVENSRIFEAKIGFLGSTRRSHLFVLNESRQ